MDKMKGCVALVGEGSHALIWVFLSSLIERETSPEDVSSLEVVGRLKWCMAKHSSVD